MELITLSSALDPNDGFRSFNIDDICKLTEKFYPQDFTEQDRIILKYQLQHYELDVLHHPSFQSMSKLSEICRGLVETRKSHCYHLIDRLIHLILTLPVSTSTTERAFSAIKIVKTSLCNKMGDGFLANYLYVHIKKEIAEIFSSESIVFDFCSMKERKAQV